MADVNGVYYDNYYSDRPATIDKSSEFNGRLTVIYDEYEAAEAASGTEILVGPKLGAGATIHDIKIIHDALGTGVTLAAAVRDLNDGTETVYLSAQAAATAGVIRPDSSDIATIPQAIDEPFVNILQIGGAAAAGTIKVQITLSNH